MSPCSRCKDSRVSERAYNVSIATLNPRILTHSLTQVGSSNSSSLLDDYNESVYNKQVHSRKDAVLLAGSNSLRPLSSFQDIQCSYKNAPLKL